MAVLRLFAQAREAVGAGRVEIPCELRTVQAALEWAVARWAPALGPVLVTARVWVNGEPVDLEAAPVPLGPDDEVAVLPPVSGGSGTPVARQARREGASSAKPAADGYAPRMSVLDRVDALIAQISPDDVSGLTIDRLRSLRDEGDELETALSYLRRLAQGSLDMVEAERERRGAGETDQAASIRRALARGVSAPGSGRPLRSLTPDLEDPELQSDLEALVGIGDLAEMDGLDDAGLDALAGRLSGVERTLSAKRQALHGFLDLIQDEVIRRYRSGEASVDSLPGADGQA